MLLSLLKKLINKNYISSIIQNELKFEIYSISYFIKDVPFGYVKAGEYIRKTKTILIADNYEHPDLAESTFVHELIHFFDYNGFPEINKHHINQINQIIANLVDFQVYPVVFVDVYKKIPPLNFNNKKCGIDSYFLKKIEINYHKYTKFKKHMELRAYRGQFEYNCKLGLQCPIFDIC